MSKKCFVDDINHDYHYQDHEIAEIMMDDGDYDDVV